MNMDKMTRDTNWTLKKEQQLLKWQHKCRIYSWGHSKASDMYNTEFIRANNLSTLITSCTSFLAGLSVIIDTHKIVFDIMILSFGLISALFIQKNKSANHQNYASSHANSSQAYQGIVIMIENILTKDSGEREDSINILDNISKQMMDITVGSNTIPDSIWNLILKCYKKGELDVSKTIKMSDFSPDEDDEYNNPQTGIAVTDCATDNHTSVDITSSETTENVKMPGYALFNNRECDGEEIQIEMGLHLNRNC